MPLTDRLQGSSTPRAGGGTGYVQAGPLRPAITLDEALAPLIQRLHRYDALRQKLETNGGTLEDLQEMTEILEHKIEVEGLAEPHDVVLTRPGSIRRFLNHVGDYRLQLQVRKRETGLPAYYLARVRRDYWERSALVVEDYYLSPGYPTRDRRFVKLMYLGKETDHLCLAPLREAAWALVEQHGYAPVEPLYAEPSFGRYAREEAPGAASHEQVDGLLFDVGRYVLQAAWHEDQHVGVLTAEHFGLPTLKQAIELLYLCLSGELCELRGVLTRPLCRFFQQVYDQPAIYAFLQQLPWLPGNVLNDLSQEHARGLYRRLMIAFKRFLNVAVPWGTRRAQVPLYKLIFANLARLDLVAEGLRDDPAIQEAAAELEASARQIVGDIMALMNGRAKPRPVRSGSP